MIPTITNSTLYAIAVMMSLSTVRTCQLEIQLWHQNSATTKSYALHEMSAMPVTNATASTLALMTPAKIAANNIVSFVMPPVNIFALSIELNPALSLPSTLPKIATVPGNSVTSKAFPITVLSDPNQVPSWDPAQYPSPPMTMYLLSINLFVLLLNN